MGENVERTTAIVVVSGFRDIVSELNPSGVLHWYCAPDSWTNIAPDRREGRNGSWSVDDSNNTLILIPPAKKDFWRKTYYQPLLIKDDGPILYAKLSTGSDDYMVETSFVFTACRQFDQAGLAVRIDPEHWIKTGIEVVDRRPRLSCVVTNIYSDWSTQSWPHYTTLEGGNLVQVACQIRIHCRGTSFVVEAKMPDGTWEFIRIAHLSKYVQGSPDDPLAVESGPWQGPSAADGEIWAGVFGATPEDSTGGTVTFTNFKITKGSSFEHTADGINE